MRVLFLVQFFEANNDFGSDRHCYLIKYLLDQGCDVTILTSDVNYKNATRKNKMLDVFSTDRTRKADYVLAYAFANFRGSYLKRVFFYISYFVSAFFKSIFLKKTDIIVAVSTPLSVGYLGYLISKVKRIPFVFEVSDVWPDAAIEVGVLKNKTLIYLAKKIEMCCYNNASKIIAYTNGIKNNIVNKNIDFDKVEIITNGIDKELFNSYNLVTQNENWDNDVKGKFLCMYLGAHGLYNSLYTIVYAAKELMAYPEIKIVLIGDGEVKNSLIDLSTMLGLNNISFVPPVSRKDSFSILSKANLFLLPNLKGDFYKMNLPNKFFDYLGTGRPIIATGGSDGEIAKLLELTGGGHVVEAENPEKLAAAIYELYMTDKEKLKSMGDSNRNYVFKNFERKLLSEKFYTIIQKTI